MYAGCVCGEGTVRCTRTTAYPARVHTSVYRVARQVKEKRDDLRAELYETNSVSPAQSISETKQEPIPDDKVPQLTASDLI